MKYLFIIIFIFSCSQTIEKKEVREAKPSELIRKSISKTNDLTGCLGEYKGMKKDANFWFKSAMCYQKFKKNGQALFYFNAALGVDPNHGPTLEQLSMEQIRVGNQNKSFEYLQAAKKLSNPKSKANLGVYLNYFKKYGKSSQTLSQVQPGSDESRYIQALNSLSKSNYQEAKIHFTQISKKAYQKINYRSYYLYTLIGLKDFKSAEKLIKGRKVAGNDLWDELVTTVNLERKKREELKMKAKNMSTKSRE